MTRHFVGARLSLAIVTMACPTLLARALRAQAAIAPRIVLHETAVTLLPDLPVRGATVDGRNIVLWSTGSPRVWVQEGVDSMSVTIGGVDAVTAAALDSARTSIEIIAQTEAKFVFVRQSLDPTRSAFRGADLAMRVEDAVVIGDEWCMVGRRTAESAVLVTCIERRNGRPTFSRELVLGDTVARVHISAGPMGVVVTRTNVPFDVWSVPRGGGATTHFVPGPLMSYVEPTSSIPPLWYAVNTVALDSGFIQTISDVRSDVRVLVLYDRLGRQIRQSAVATAMAFFACDYGRRELIAIRQSDVRELAWYQWSWQ